MTFLEATAEDKTLVVGMPVTVRWGYGSGFRACGVGVITGLYAKSVRVTLSEDVSMPGEPSKIGWPKGFELRGIPRAQFGNVEKWNSEHCVEVA